MATSIVEQLMQAGLSSSQADAFWQKITDWQATLSPTQCWQRITHELLTPQLNFRIHKYLYDLIYADSDFDHPGPAWIPDQDYINDTNLAKLMQTLNFNDYAAFHRWSYQHYSDFWQYMVNTLGIVFKQPYQSVCDLNQGIEKPQWLAGSRLNIVDSCFKHNADKPAIIYQTEDGEIEQLRLYELKDRVAQVANSLVAQGFKKHDVIAIIMPMTIEAIAIYLGIISMGGTVMSIAESYAAEEIATRLHIGNAKAVFTQDFILRKHKQLPLYARITQANAPLTIVLPSLTDLNIRLRQSDLAWNDFLLPNNSFTSVDCQPSDHINILFSSGTTGQPKAIPWDHTCAIKCASDSYLHQNIQPDDVVAWPTSLGWMMGPWLVFSALINQASIALFYGAPTDHAFVNFVEHAKVNMLGVVPSMVKHWREHNMLAEVDWSNIKSFSTTAEPSNPDDMLYLMASANYRPVIEYCGGTEVVGYLTSTHIHNNIPSTFSTPALGLNIVLFDENGELNSHQGEVGIIPPSMGLSTELLNRNHHKEYYADMPMTPGGFSLRRHGDYLQRLDNGYYRALGRTDDTMKIAGIKISSIKIERLLSQLTVVHECAAIAVPPPDGGPLHLVIYAVLAENSHYDQANLKAELQTLVKQHLNPLLKIYEVKLIKELPRTATNKIMRRVLRDNFRETHYGREN